MYKTKICNICCCFFFSEITDLEYRDDAIEVTLRKNNPLSCTEKMTRFYQAPSVKFFSTVVCKIYKVTEWLPRFEFGIARCFKKHDKKSYCDIKFKIVLSGHLSFRFSTHYFAKLFFSSKPKHSFQKELDKLTC